MSVTVRLPFVLRSSAGGAARLSAAGATVEALIADIDRRFPGFATLVLDEDGGLRGHLVVFVDGDDVRRGAGLATAVHDGGEVTIQHAMSGG